MSFADIHAEVKLDYPFVLNQVERGTRCKQQHPLTFKTTLKPTWSYTEFS